MKRGLPKVSKKRLAANGGKLPFSTFTGAKAKGSRFPKMRDRAYTRWITGLPCCVGATEGARCWHPTELVVAGRISDPAHVEKNRGVGAPDVGEVAPLCRKHHKEQEPDKRAFDDLYGVDTRRLAKALVIRYEREVLGVSL